MSSIREVAKLAGVSPATVSRVINGTANVDTEKRQRVLYAIDETGFIPNEVARALFRRSAKLIGLVIPSLKNPFFTQLAACIDQAAGEQGYRMFLCDVGTDEEKSKSTLQMLASMNVDGVVLAAHNRGIQEGLTQCRIPVVSVDAVQETGNVLADLYCDDYSGGRMALEHLLACGCRQIVCIQGDQRIFSARMRYQGYRDFCREQGIPEQTVECDYDFHAGKAMLETLFRRYPHVDGIIACNDLVAISTYKALYKRKIRVPQDVQLIGFDDINAAQLLTPSLTTLRQPVGEMAQRAVELLIENKELREKDRIRVFPVSLVIRETTRRKEEYV